MVPNSAQIDAILGAHGIPGPWHALPALGVANTIFATDEVVLRVATDHEQAVSDARTESVAAPAAYAAGIRTPRLIAFDDSRSIVDRPYTLWERVHGETVGTHALDPEARLALWHDVGRELGRLHGRVMACEDPNGWLDAPSRHRGLESDIRRLRDAGVLSAREAGDMLAFVRDLEPLIDVAAPRCFVHDDLHAWNVMCSARGDLLAVIDWGDAGWGDPTIDFGYMPVDVVRSALTGYAHEAPTLLGPDAAARIAWDQLHHGLERMIYLGEQAPSIVDLRQLLER